MFFYFNVYFNKIDVVLVIDLIIWSGGFVVIDVVLKLMRDDVFNVKNGVRIGVVKVMVFLIKSFLDNRKVIE